MNKALIVVGALLLLGIIGVALAPADEENGTRAVQEQVDDAADDDTEATTEEEQTTTEEEDATAEADEETTTEEEDEEEPEEPELKAPPPVVVRGSGAEVESVNLAVDSPAVVAGLHRGTSNFIVRLVPQGGSGEAYLFNAIGNYNGEVIYSEAASGRYRLVVQGDGSWTIAISQPVPRPNDKRVPGAITGRGDDVVKLRAEDDLQPVVEGTHRGQSNFIVQLVGYAENSGTEYLFNEIGNFSGETLVNDMPSGTYLLAVQADGPWSLTFSP